MDKRPSTVGQIIRQGALAPRARPRPAPIGLREIQEADSLQLPLGSPTFGLNTPGGTTFPATPNTLDRGRRFRSLIKVQPSLPVVIHQAVSRFRDHAGTRDRSVVMKIFLYLFESFAEEDPVLKQRLVDLALDEVAASLKIDRCIIEQARKQVRRCCRDRFACCFPCLSI